MLLSYIVAVIKTNNEQKYRVCRMRREYGSGIPIIPEDITVQDLTKSELQTLMKTSAEKLVFLHLSPNLFWKAGFKSNRVKAVPVIDEDAGTITRYAMMFLENDRHGVYLLDTNGKLYSVSYSCFLDPQFLAGEKDSVQGLSSPIVQNLGLLDYALIYQSMSIPEAAVNYLPNLHDKKRSARGIVWEIPEFTGSVMTFHAPEASSLQIQMPPLDESLEELRIKIPDNRNHKVNLFITLWEFPKSLWEKVVWEFAEGLTKITRQSYMLNTDSVTTYGRCQFPSTLRVLDGYAGETAVTEENLLKQLTNIDN